MPNPQFTIDLAFPSSMSREDFILGGCNQSAVDWIDRWPDWPGHIRGLVLHGPADCGKSHLGAIWAKKSGAELMTALDADSIKGLDKNPHVVWDHPMPSSAWPDDLVFHILNRLAELDGSVLILSRLPMGGLDWKLADTASRLNGLVAAMISPPDDDVLMGVMHKLADDCGLVLDPEVVRYIVSRIDRSFTTAKDVIADLNQQALSAHHKLTIPLAREVLSKQKYSGQFTLDFNGEKNGTGN